jgi:hypothetical protein
MLHFISSDTKVCQDLQRNQLYISLNNNDNSIQGKFFRSLEITSHHPHYGASVPAVGRRLHICERKEGLRWILTQQTANCLCSGQFIAYTVYSSIHTMQNLILAFARQKLLTIIHKLVDNLNSSKE